MENMSSTENILEQILGIDIYSPFSDLVIINLMSMLFAVVQDPSTSVSTFFARQFNWIHKKPSMPATERLSAKIKATHNNLALSIVL